MPNTLERLKAALGSRYLVERQLATGGMAVVFLATDRKHQRHVAIKVMRPEIAAALGAERFLREISIAAVLQHPHILTLIDSGEADGLLYYVMPWVDGESLADRLARERQLPLEDALRIAAELVNALSYAHAHGVIHRDIKPDNILLSGGHAFVTDFGIARAVGVGGGDRLTDTGIAVGTPAYMSPEQALGLPDVDGRTDIYGVGCVLYEMLSGEPPFTGPTPQAVIARRLNQPVPSVSVIRPTVGPALDGVLRKALAREPVDRFASAAEFAAALSTSLAAPQLTGTRVRRAMVWLAALGALSFGTTLLLREKPQPPVSPVTLKRLTSSGVASDPVLSPEGRRIAFVTANRSLVVQRLDGGDAMVLVPTSRFLVQPKWTGDGSAILFWMFRDSLTLAGTWMVPSSGGAPRQVLDDQDAYDAGPDSTVAMRFNRPRRTLELVELSSGRIGARYPVPDSVAVGFFDAVAWSPAGGLVALAGRGLWILRLADSTLHRVAPEGVDPTWDAGGRSLFYLAGPAGAVDLWQVEVDGTTGRSVGVPRRVLSLPRARRFDIGPAGQFVMEEASSTSQALLMTVPANRAHPAEPAASVLSTGSASVLQVDISPDGESVALARELSGNMVLPEGGGVSRRLTVDLTPFSGGSLQPLASTSSSQFSPRWAPDGRRLTVVRSESGGDFVTLVSLADHSARRLGTRPAVGGMVSWANAAWSADDSRVVYLSAPNYLIVVDPERLTEIGISIPDSVGTVSYGQAISPHGDTVIVTTNRRPTDWAEEWLVEVATRRWSRVIEPFGNNWPLRWLPDGTIYVGNDRAVASEAGPSLREIWAIHVNGAPPQFITRLPAGCVAPSISANGARVACDYHREVTDVLAASDFTSARQ
jgi:serine/threonine protein kinase/Tol biopolymer transport system component